ncbi:MAG: YceI family protein [Acidobacteriota bacterium]
MKKHTLLAVLTLLAVAALALPASAQTYEIDKTHSDFTFHAHHLLSKVPGKFADVAGTIVLDDKDLTKSTVEIKIQAASLSTQNETRDKHLRSDEFFGVEKCPQITFVSQKIEPTKDKDVYDVTGPLTMHCITKQITLPVHYLGKEKDPWGNLRAFFEASTTINRKDFNMLWNKTLDGGGFLLADNVDVTISISAIPAQPAKK